MNWIEIALLIFGAGVFIVSFLVTEKSDEEEGEQKFDAELVRSFIEKEMEDAKGRVTEVVDETLEYAVEKTERATERISNEKIMAISEYSETVLADINKSHQEVMFLYDMLNDKHNNLKETVKHVDKTAKEAEEAANAAAIALAAKAKEEAEAKERERLEAAKKASAPTRASWDKDEREKEFARRQMARLILPMQQEMTMHHQVDARSMDFGPLGGRQQPVLEPAMPRPVPAGFGQPAVQQPSAPEPDGLRPLVVKSVEIVKADIVTSNDMQPVPDNTAMVPVSAAQLQTLGSRPEDMKVVDVRPADIRPVEVYSFVEQAPHIERPVRREAREAPAARTPVQKGAGFALGHFDPVKEGLIAKTPVPEPKENNNDAILRLHRAGYSNVDIAKELGLGVGEVKLVINLFKGAV